MADGKRKARKAKTKVSTAHLKKKKKVAIPHRGGGVPSKGTIKTTRTIVRAPKGGAVKYKRKKT
jgi:glycine cleavage system protein P-like pyridoxal-binding family